jgi:hypothetical protein
LDWLQIFDVQPKLFTNQQTLMKKFLYALSVLTLGFTACEKRPPEQTLDPTPVAAFTRTISYTNRGTTNAASYDTSRIEALATIDNNDISLAFLASPRTPLTAGDAIAFQLDKTHLQALAKTYNLDGKTLPTILAVRYTYSYMKEDGLWRGSISDSGMGLQFGGSLTIEKWDPFRKLLSGFYRVEIKNLINDPVQDRVAQPIDPNDLCDVTVTGTFSNVKVQMD